MTLGVLEKLAALLPSGLTIHACGVRCASGADTDTAAAAAAGGEMWLRSIGNELYRTVDRSPLTERPISSAMDVDEDEVDVDVIELLLSVSESISSGAGAIETVQVVAVEDADTVGVGAGKPEGGVRRSPCAVASSNQESK